MDLVGVALILFLRRDRSLWVLTVRVLDFLSLLSSGAPFFRSIFDGVDETTRHTSKSNDVFSLVSGA